MKLETPAWQDDITVSKENLLQHLSDVDNFSEFLENTGNRASLKIKIFGKEFDWPEYISEKGKKHKIMRTEEILAFEPPLNLKEIRLFLGSVQYLGKFIPNLTDKTKPS